MTAIEEKALRLVQDMGMQDRVIWSSFNHYSIEKVRPAGPRCRDRLSLRRHYLRRGKVRPPPTGWRGLHPGLYNVKMADLLQRYLASGLAVRV